jgi:hypothetical protein
MQVIEKGNLQRSDTPSARCLNFFSLLLFITEGKTFQSLTGMVKGSEKESGSSYTITSHGDKSSSKDMEEEQFADNAVVGSAEFFEDLESHRAIKVGHSLP